MKTHKYTARPSISTRRGIANDRSGFTIVELVVVLVTLAIVVVTLLPALAASKPNSQLFQCMNNLKQLQRAWLMYADDNADRLVNLSTYCKDANGNVVSVDSRPAQGVPWRTQFNDMSVTVPAEYPAGNQSAQLFLTEWGFRQPVNNLAPSLTTDGPLYQYYPNLDAEHCPADTRSQLPASQNGGNYTGPYAWDSYSGTAYLNGEQVYSGGFFKRTQVLHPSSRFTWTEAAESRGENLGSWEMSNPGTAAANFTDAQFADSPASFHQTSSVFPFVDGHVEAHKWQDPTTVAYANDMTSNKDSGIGTKTAANHPGNPDLQWLGSHYPGPGNP